MYTMRQVIKS